MVQGLRPPQCFWINSVVNAGRNAPHCDTGSEFIQILRQLELNESIELSFKRLAEQFVA